MPRGSNANAADHRLEQQVVELKNKLRECEQAVKDMQAQQEQAIQEAADIGYELACLDFEEREIHRAEAIAAAVEKFEKAHMKKSLRATAVAKAAKEAPAAAPRHSQRAKAAPVAAKPAAKKARERAKARPDVEVVEPMVVSAEQDMLN